MSGAESHEGFAGQIVMIMRGTSAFGTGKPERVAILEVRSGRGELRLGPARVVTALSHVHLVRVLAMGSRLAGSSRGQAATSEDADLRVIATELEDGLLTNGLSLFQDGEESSRSETLDDVWRSATQQGELRHAAVQILAKQGEAAPIEPLLRALNDDTRLVRSKAASALANIGRRAPMEPFLAAIRDKSTENQGVRSAAARVLAAHPEDAPIEALVELVHDNDGSVRASAAWALGQLGERAPVEPLVDALRTDSASGVNWYAAWALAQLGERAPIAPLIDALDHSMLYVRAQIAGAMMRLRHRLSPDDLARVEAVLAEQRDLDRRMAEHERSVKTLFERHFEPDTLETWLAALEHPEWQTRAAAVRRLSTLPNVATLAVLLRMLTDSDDSVVIAAAETLATLGGKVAFDETVAEALFARLDHADDDVEFALVEAIRTLAPWLPLGALVAHLGDLHWRLREAAIEALANIGDAAPAEPLIAAVGFAFEHDREKALETLQLTHPDALDVLAREAAAELVEEQVGPILGSIVRTHVAHEIARLKLTTSAALETLAELLDWPYWQVRMEALNALGELAYAVPRAMLGRIATLVEDKESSAVREAARKAAMAIEAIKSAGDGERKKV